jgi:molybdate transport system substrate-binding protein
VRKVLVLAMSVVLLLAACSDSDDGGETTGASGGSGGAEAELTVSAASEAFEAANPGTSVTFNFGPSDGLAGQINEGAPVDVFASASPTWMDSVQEDGPGVTGRADFAQNRLAIIVPVDNAAGIENLNDLTEDGTQLVLAAEGVPAGDYAREIFQNAGISTAALANVVSNEEDVKTVITKVMSGEADAGIGYVTDVTPDVADQISLNSIPDEVNVIATYPIAVVNGSEEADLAQSFVEYVLGDGQQTLAGYGFLPPP